MRTPCPEFGRRGSIHLPNAGQRVPRAAGIRIDFVRGCAERRLMIYADCSAFVPNLQMMSTIQNPQMPFRGPRMVRIHKWRPQIKMKSWCEGRLWIFTDNEPHLDCGNGRWTFHENADRVDLFCIPVSQFGPRRDSSQWRSGLSGLKVI